MGVFAMSVGSYKRICIGVLSGVTVMIIAGWIMWASASVVSLQGKAQVTESCIRDIKDDVKMNNRLIQEIHYFLMGKK
jgi:hypothetical protein